LKIKIKLFENNVILFEGVDFEGLKKVDELLR
jgi:hypothetical protein